MPVPVQVSLSADTLFVAHHHPVLAEQILQGISAKNGEWYFLMGSIAYRRGWLDEARRYYGNACQMDPGNAEYQQALDFMENGAAGSYRPGGGIFATDMCDDNNLCLRMCCAYMLCNGCGMCAQVCPFHAIKGEEEVKA